MLQFTLQDLAVVLDMPVEVQVDLMKNMTGHGCSPAKSRLKPATEKLPGPSFHQLKLVADRESAEAD